MLLLIDHRPKSPPPTRQTPHPMPFIDGQTPYIDRHHSTCSISSRTRKILGTINTPPSTSLRRVRRIWPDAFVPWRAWPQNSNNLNHNTRSLRIINKPILPRPSKRLRKNCVRFCFPPRRLPCGLRFQHST